MKKVTAGRDILGEFVPKFAEVNDDILFWEVWSREDKLLAKIEIEELKNSIFDIEKKWHLCSIFYWAKLSKNIVNNSNTNI